MARFNEGVHGRFSGRIGSVVASSWKGRGVYKIRPKKSTKPKTEAQLDQQSKFSLIMQFLGNIDKIIKRGYLIGTDSVTPMNTAFKYHEQHAVSGVYPAYTLDYTGVRLSDQRSKGQPLQNHTMEVLPLLKVELNWDTFLDADYKVTHATDKLVGVFYCPEKNSYLSVPTGVIRSAGTVVINIPRSFSGTVLHGWAFFESVDGKHVSPTEYLGVATIIE